MIPVLSGPRAYVPPPGMAWPAIYDPKIVRAGNVYICRLVPRSFVNSAVWSGPAYKVDGVSGSDGNTGGPADGDADFTHAVKTISKAVTLGNATAAAYRVIVKSGTYDYLGSINSTTGAVRVSRHCAFIASGGRVYHGSHHSSLTWSLDTGTTYKATMISSSFSVAGFVLDLLAPDASDSTLHTELAHVADAATCRTTAGSFFDDGAGTLYVNRADGAAVTNSNTRVIQWLNVATQDTTTAVDLYYEGFDFRGGRGGALNIVPTSGAIVRNIVTVNCTYAYGGKPASVANGRSIDRFSGLSIAWGDKAVRNSADGFNQHDNAASGNSNALYYNCIGSNNGRYDGTSCNGLTGHEDCKAIDIGGDYESNFGADVHFIQNTLTAFYGTVSKNSTDTSNPGQFKCSFSSGARPQMWLHGTTAQAADSSHHAIYAQGGYIYKHNHRTVLGDEFIDTSGIIGAR